MEGMSSNADNFFKKHKGILLVVLLAMIIRGVYLFAYQGLPAWDQLTVDNYYHHNWAQSIANGNIIGDTTYFRAPLYVFCLGLLYSLFGASLWVARIFGVVVGVFSVVMTYRIGTKVFHHKAGEWLADDEAHIEGQAGIGPG